MKVPQIIADVAFTSWVWDLKKLHTLEMPVTKMAVDELSWHLDYPFWWSKVGYPASGRYDIYPRDVIALHGQARPTEFKDEYEKALWKDYDQTLAADYANYPLDIIFYKGRWLFLDGLHRLVHAIIDGQTTVKVRKVTKEFAEQILLAGKELPADLEA